MYGCETWTVIKDDSRRLAALETKLLRRIAGITYVDRVSNAGLLKGPQYNTTILKRARVQQFRWLGHVQWMSNYQLHEIAFKSLINGSHPRGRPPKRWKENFSDCNLHGLLRMVQNREQCRQKIHSLVRRGATRRPPMPDGTIYSISFRFLKFNIFWLNYRIHNFIRKSLFLYFRSRHIYLLHSRCPP